MAFLRSWLKGMRSKKFMSMTNESQEIKQYVVTINTGENGDRRAEIHLFGANEKRVGRIYFNDPDARTEADFVDRGSNPVVHLPSSMLQSTLDLLRNESPVFIQSHAISTSKEPVGEEE
jgi:hypothetical protein